MKKSKLLWILIGITAIIAALTYGGFSALWIVAVLVYFIPSALAKMRNKRNSDAIMLLNLLLGWTVIGWIVALIWAATVDVPEAAVR